MSSDKAVVTASLYILEGLVWPPVAAAIDFICSKTDGRVRTWPTSCAVAMSCRHQTHRLSDILNYYTVTVQCTHITESSQQGITVLYIDARHHRWFPGSAVCLVVLVLQHTVTVTEFHS